MPITFTTINNDSAVAKTFTEISKDKYSSEWLNTTDSTSAFDCRIHVKQQVIPAGKKNRVSLRRALVQARCKAPVVTLDFNGGSHIQGYEEILVNLTLTLPEQLVVLTTSNRNDTVAYIRNAVTTALVSQLHQGQV